MNAYMMEFTCENEIPEVGDGLPALPTVCSRLSALGYLLLVLWSGLSDMGCVLCFLVLTAIRPVY